MHLNPVSVTAGFYTTPEGSSAGYPGYQGSRQCPMGKWAVFRTQILGIERHCSRTTDQRSLRAHSEHFLARGWQRIISVFRVDFHVWTPNAHLDLAVASNARLGRVSQRVLIAGVSDGPGGSALDVSLRQLVVYLASSCGDVFGQNVAVAHQCPGLWDMDALQLVIDRNGRAFHAHGIQGDTLRQQHFQGVGVTGRRALLPPIADHEDDLPPVPAAL